MTLFDFVLMINILLRKFSSTNNKGNNFVDQKPQLKGNNFVDQKS